MTGDGVRRTSGDERARLLGGANSGIDPDEENRVPQAGVGGYRAVTDDSVKKPEIRQAPMVMVPKGTARAAAGAGGMMMPPVMGGMGRGMGADPTAAAAASGLATRGGNMSVSGGGAFGSAPVGTGMSGTTMAAGSTPDFSGSYYGGPGDSDRVGGIESSDKTVEGRAAQGGAAAAEEAAAGLGGDIQVQSESLERASRQWQDFGDELGEVLGIVNARSGDVGFGKVIQPKAAYEELAETARTSIQQVNDGFGTSSQQLHSTLGAYRATEDDNVQKIKGVA